MKFRKPVLEDISELKNISAKFKDEYNWAEDIPIANIDTDQKAENRLFSNDLGSILIAEDNNKMVGYLAVKRFEVEEETGYEASIIIDTDYRNMGLAKKMTKMVFEEILKDKEVEAWIHEDNIPSLKTVQSLGFKFKKYFEEDKKIKIFTKYGNRQGE
ncbi:MAG: N-acetyltransferase family protein [Bacillota bacterium]